jgi:hypothetical protein
LLIHILVIDIQLIGEFLIEAHFLIELDGDAASGTDIDDPCRGYRAIYLVVRQHIWVGLEVYGQSFLYHCLSVVSLEYKR